MENEFTKNIVLRKISINESIPYQLLLDADPSRALIDNYLPTSEVYVAILGDKQVGVYLLYPESADVVELKNIAVDEQYQRMGIGKMMLKDAVQRAAAKGFKTIIIGTGNSSIGQLYLYQKIGFQITGIKKNFFTDNYPETLYENGIQVKHMIMLAKQL